MTSDPADRLSRLLGGTDTDWLRARVRRRLERGKPLTGKVVHSAASETERQAIERLLGRRASTARSLSVSLDDVDQVLRRSGLCPGGLAFAVELLDGPVQDIAGRAAAEAASWKHARARFDMVVQERSELIGWRNRLDAIGLIRRLTSDPGTARAHLDRLASVVERLPSPGVPLGRLAAETCGDAHALDDGPLATLALSAARALGGLPFRADGGAESRRKAWARVGVHLDELSSTALCIGLHGDDRTPLGRILAASRSWGEPVALTLRQLRRHDGGLMSPGLVRICENPSVVAAAADALGDRCAPLVCVNGQPSLAVWRLLELLADGGAEFAYHGDFDWGGIEIAAAVRRRVGWRPWRYDVVSYLAAVDRVSDSAASLDERRSETPWDPALSAVVADRAVRVEEEIVLGDLLTDLAERPG
ncbi:TIGR02679 family protein [Thermomonospora umbrina]|uniref:Uncharacterized protein (TIGR02679 family) n=1 Tax=Thermomonospora umbrina TaxID=111806 RepID=A0A3D9SJ75_9ACTN|nr:TIGR02679 family protein [Thermomonospora umbrina]REE95972.1 uncharacterized protein (TIGR02679 family) [Thermomonospora umbrina]